MKNKSKVLGTICVLALIPLIFAGFAFPQENVPSAGNKRESAKTDSVDSKESDGTGDSGSSHPSERNDLDAVRSIAGEEADAELLADVYTAIGEWYWAKYASRYKSFVKKHPEVKALGDRISKNQSERSILANGIENRTLEGWTPPDDLLARSLRKVIPPRLDEESTRKRNEAIVRLRKFFFLHELAAALSDGQRTGKVREWLQERIEKYSPDEMSSDKSPFPIARLGLNDDILPDPEFLTQILNSSDPQALAEAYAEEHGLSADAGKGFDENLDLHIQHLTRLALTSELLRAERDALLPEDFVRLREKSREFQNKATVQREKAKSSEGK